MADEKTETNLQELETEYLSLVDQLNLLVEQERALALRHGTEFLQEIKKEGYIVTVLEEESLIALVQGNVSRQIGFTGSEEELETMNAKAKELLGVQRAIYNNEVSEYNNQYDSLEEQIQSYIDLALENTGVTKLVWGKEAKQTTFYVIRKEELCAVEFENNMPHITRHHKKKSRFFEESHLTELIETIKENDYYAVILQNPTKIPAHLELVQWFLEQENNYEQTQGQEDALIGELREKGYLVVEENQTKQ